MLKRAVGVVTEILESRPGAVELLVEIENRPCRAIAFSSLVDIPETGDSVVVNTTAVDLNLGTGGLHFVIENLSRRSEHSDEPGHIMKLRYTPLQHSVLSVEEDGSPWRSVIDGFTNLGGMPVVVGELHSQLAPAAAAIKRLTHPKAKVVYVMTDSASLPIALSRTVYNLKDAGLIDFTITAGQAFGGDFESVNVFTALIAAKCVCGADAVIVCQGPGNAGTGTKYGYSGIEQGEIINAVGVLGGTPIAVARISFADNRPRHSGISHHTLTALGEVALVQALLVLPMMDEMKILAVEQQIQRTAISYKHRVRVIDGIPGIRECDELGIELMSMGRSYKDDPEFFLAASAAGAAAAELTVSERR